MYKVSETVKEAVVYIIESHNNLPNTSENKHSNEQLSLDKFLESTTIPDKCIKLINRVLIKAFVYCKLPWRLIEHLFFIEFLKQLYLAYTPPYGWTSLTDIYLDNSKDIFWKIQDYSNASHTADFLTKEIQKILKDIGTEKFIEIEMLILI
ncbi:9764_t:CDS:2 [Racocetra persica]|uniref:9764_t:CDS:1 n=1 Tax=Racocetra persica TaxID=160502 RepID=A0ACA9MEL5_9GLOM|nr:9764_t:CDS:2 [Racocetra persica]